MTMICIDSSVLLVIIYSFVLFIIIIRLLMGTSSLEVNVEWERWENVIRFYFFTWLLFTFDIFPIFFKKNEK